MKLKYRLFAIAVAALGLLPLSSLAAAEKEDISHIFCEAVKDEKLYDERGYGAYKVLLQGKDGWIFRSEADLTSDFSFTRSGLRNIRLFRDALKSEGMELVILLTPAKGLMHASMLYPEDAARYGFDDPDSIWKNYFEAVEDLRREGIHVVSLEPIKEEDQFFYKRDHHWNAYGARKAAKAISAYIERMPVFDEVKRMDWETMDLGPYQFEGVSKKVFSDLCDTRQPPEMIHVYDTIREGMAEGKDALFGEIENPDIVLLGTSNSTPEPSFANFHGFLRDELEADVINMSVSGGGLDTAVISYLNSQYYKEQPAKIAIWEVPGYYDISAQHAFFRQAIPAVYGDCGENAIASREDVKVTDNAVIVLDRLADKKISGSNYYVHVNFSKPVRKYLSFDLRYVKDREKIKIRREDRYPHDGEYYLSLSDQKETPLGKVILYVPNNVIGATVDARICKMPGTKKDGWLKALFRN